MAKFAVLIFPGSNCDHDAYHALKHVMGAEAEFVWHKETSLGKVDAVVIPGGFSYGDYLRTGAIARFSPIMQDVVKFANNGGLVLGICNGFQILLEAGLLPGAMLANELLRFRCKQIYIRTEQTDTPFTNAIEKNRAIQIPIAHGEGNYTAPERVLDEIEANNQVVFRYCDALGNVTTANNPNGSLNNIAGICNRQRNVLGMMPHPERACESHLGSEDGRLIFQSVINSLEHA